MFWLGPLGVTVMQMENNNASVHSERGGRVIEMLSPAACSPLLDLFMRLPRHGVTAKKGKVLGTPPRTSGNLLLGKRREGWELPCARCGVSQVLSCKPRPRCIELPNAVVASSPAPLWHPWVLAWSLQPSPAFPPAPAERVGLFLS